MPSVCRLLYPMCRTVLLHACTKMSKACLHAETCARQAPGAHAVRSLLDLVMALRIVWQNFAQSDSTLDVCTDPVGVLCYKVRLAAHRLGCTATISDWPHLLTIGASTLDCALFVLHQASKLDCDAGLSTSLVLITA